MLRDSDRGRSRRARDVTSAAPNRRAIRIALKRNTRSAIPLRVDVRKPKVTSVHYDGAIVILRSSNRLLYYDNAK